LNGFFLKVQQGRPLPVFFLYMCKNKERWYLQSTRIEEPKGKKEGNAKKNSLSTNLKPLLFSAWL
jgi:hypothetical protein